MHNVVLEEQRPGRNLSVVTEYTSGAEIAPNAHVNRHEMAARS